MLPFATEDIGKYFQSKTHFTIKNTYTPMMDYWDKKILGDTVSFPNTRNASLMLNPHNLIRKRPE